jgi:hypothetical protein
MPSPELIKDVARRVRKRRLAKNPVSHAEGMLKRYKMNFKKRTLSGEGFIYYIAKYKLRIKVIEAETNAIIAGKPMGLAIQGCLSPTAIGGIERSSFPKRKRAIIDSELERLRGRVVDFTTMNTTASPGECLETLRKIHSIQPKLPA